MNEHSIGNDDICASGDEFRLRIGSKLLLNAYTGTGILLLKAGARIQTQAELHRLLQPDVRFGPNRIAEIPVDLANEITLDASVSQDSPQIEQYENYLERAQTIKCEVVGVVKNVFERIGCGEENCTDSAFDAASHLLDSMLEEPRAMVSLSLIKNTDEYTYTHCVNVCILAIYLAMHTKYLDKLESVAIGALLHDVGKIQIPQHILAKNGPLNYYDWKIMKQHPQIGYNLLKQAGLDDEIALECVLDHHERITGVGYPSGKKSNEISPFARITMLADVYDALTTDRPYRKAMNPKDAMLAITQNASNGLDAGLLNTFVSLIGYFPVGSKVKLSTGESAVVFRNHPSYPLRPCVQRISKTNDIIDLREKQNISIKGFISEHNIKRAAA